MKNILAIFVLLFATNFAKAQPMDNVLTEAEKKAGWKLLFDGASLKGWRMYQNKSAECWEAKAGEIACKGSSTDKSDLRGDLVTTDEYGDFELSVDWKIAPTGNSGIIYHALENHKASYESGPEYQLIDDEGYPAKLEEFQKTGSDYAMYPATTRPVKPIGEWNTSKIIAKGAHREYWLNGVKVVEFEAWTPDWTQRKTTGKWKDYPDYGMAKAGHICLQDHGSGVWFKNVKIRKL